MAPGSRQSLNLKLFQGQNVGNAHANQVEYQGLLDFTDVLAKRNIRDVVPRKKHSGRKRRFSELENNEGEGTSINLQELNNEDIDDVNEVSKGPHQSFHVDVPAIANIKNLPSSSHGLRNRRSSRLKFFEEHSFGNEYVNPVELQQLLGSDDVSANKNIRDVAHRKKRPQRKRFSDLESVEGESSELSYGVDADPIGNVENIPSLCGQALYQRSRQDHQILLHKILAWFCHSQRGNSTWQTIQEIQLHEDWILHFFTTIHFIKDAHSCIPIQNPIQTVCRGNAWVNT